MNPTPPPVKTPLGPVFSRAVLVLFVLAAVAAALTAWLWLPARPVTVRSAPTGFDGERALQDVVYQVQLGPRLPGTPAHQQAGDWVLQNLRQAGWQAEEQFASYQGQPIRNLVGRLEGSGPWILLGAHYDTRLITDQDPDPQMRSEPGPGANDGASGVALLLEMARLLPVRFPDPAARPQVWLVFFDAEDNGSIAGWDWILGSQAFASQLSGTPDAVVVVDMIGDRDQNIYLEYNSDAELMKQIWDVAGRLGYGDRFIPEYKYAILDDHLPFAQRGIRAVDLIDFDYPYWHTQADTPDKVSAESLQAVGETLDQWLQDQMKP